MAAPRDETAPRTLVAGWFSFARRGATAGDLVVRDLVCGWLEEAGVPFDVANDPPFSGGVDWRAVDPARYPQVVFACGPFWVGRRVRSLPGWSTGALVGLERRLGHRPRSPLGPRVLELFVHRFRGSRLLGVNLSMVGGRPTDATFHALWERDSDVITRPDLALAGDLPQAPVVGVCLADAQGEYAETRHDRAAAAFEGLGRRFPMARVPIDTRLDIPNRGGLRDPAEIAALLGRMDVVLTTRLHGLVLALRQGVPVLAVDAVPGGAKVTRQAAVLGWPCVVPIEELDDERIDRAWAYASGDEGRARAAEIRPGAAPELDAVGEELRRVAAEPLGSPPPEGLAA